MPLEVTPPPFAASQRLPYTPAIARPEINGMQSSISIAGGQPGPASAAASAIIPPAPGGIAGPHRAIAALPDAGYTAPTLRPAAISIGFNDTGSISSSLYDHGGMRGSVIPPRSAVWANEPDSHYSILPPRPQHTHHHRQLAPLAVIQSDGWGGASSLPESRRALPPRAESVIAPKSRQHHQSHHQHHRTPSIASSNYEEWDRHSDASYYAMPKSNRVLRARSGSVSSVSEASSPREVRPAIHHRSRSISGEHHRHSANGPLQSASHRHSPISPSPLAGDGNGNERNDEADNGDNGGYQAVGDPRQSPAESAMPGHRHKVSAGKDKKPSPSPDQAQGKETRSRLQSIVPDDREKNHDKNRYRREETRLDHDRTKGKQPSGGGAICHQVQQRPQVRRHHSDQHYHSLLQHQDLPDSAARTHDRVHESGHHHRHRSTSHLAPAASERAYLIPPSPPASLSRHLQPDSHQHHTHRRRAVSMHALERLPGGPGGTYQAPSIVGSAYRDAAVHDDGASLISDTNLTFMDGSVAGRTSQYGLPQYPFRPRFDHRRCCVQRGKADVYLD